MDGMGKVNQIGSVTESIAAWQLCKDNKFLVASNGRVQQKKCGDTTENEGLFGTWKSPWKYIKETYLKQITFIFLGFNMLNVPGCLFDFSEEVI